jgi:hypothetical protein
LKPTRTVGNLKTALADTIDKCSSWILARNPITNVEKQSEIFSTLNIIDLQNLCIQLNKLFLNKNICCTILCIFARFNFHDLSTKKRTSRVSKIRICVLYFPVSVDVLLSPAHVIRVDANTDHGYSLKDSTTYISQINYFRHYCNPGMVQCLPRLCTYANSRVQQCAAYLQHAQMTAAATHMYCITVPTCASSSMQHVVMPTNSLLF